LESLDNSKFPAEVGEIQATTKSSGSSCQDPESMKWISLSQLSITTDADMPPTGHRTAEGERSVWELEWGFRQTKYEGLKFRVTCPSFGNSKARLLLCLENPDNARSIGMEL
jgi:hypothetical protein